MNEYFILILLLCICIVIIHHDSKIRAVTKYRQKIADLELRNHNLEMQNELIKQNYTKMRDEYFLLSKAAIIKRIEDLGDLPNYICDSDVRGHTGLQNARSAIEKLLCNGKDGLLD